MVTDGHVMDSMVGQIKLVQGVTADISTTLLLIFVKLTVQTQSIDILME